MRRSAFSRFFIVILITIFLSCITFAFPSYAAEYQSQLIIRDIGSPILLKELNLPNQEPLAEIKNAEEKLLQLSVRLRDIARTLGTSWPVVVPLHTTIEKDNQNNSANQKTFKITDIKDADGVWRSMAVGHAIKLISQEVYALKSNRKQPTADFLIRDDASNKYYQLLNVPLDIYCTNLLNKFS